MRRRSIAEYLQEITVSAEQTKLSGMSQRKLLLPAHVYFIFIFSLSTQPKAFWLPLIDTIFYEVTTWDEIIQK